MDNNQPVSSRRTSPSPSNLFATIVKIIWLLVVLIVILLSIRVILSLIGANPDNDFAAFIYNSTYVFVEPFRGLLQVGELQVGVARLEFETIVAIIVYLLVASGITAAMSAFRR